MMQGIRGEVDPEALQDLGPGDFAKREYRTIYKAILRTLKEGDVPSPPAVCSRLRDMDELTNVGGVAFVAAIPDGLEGDRNLPQYAARVKEKANRRSIRAKAATLQDATNNGYSDAEIAGIAHGIVADITAHGKESRLPYINLQAAFEEPEEAPWIITGFLARNDLTYLAGEGEAGKSWIGMELALAVAAGEPFLGRYKPAVDRPQRVLFVDEENSLPQVKRRLGRLCRGRGWTAEQVRDLPLHYLCRAGFNLDDPAKRAILHRQIQVLKPDVLILDSLIRFHRRDENSNSDMGEFFGTVLKPFTERNLALFVLHHLAKPSADRPSDIGHRLRGASEVYNQADMIWGVEQGGNGRQLLHCKTRWGERALSESVRIEDTGPGASVVHIPTDGPLALRVARGLLRDAGETGVLQRDLIDAIREECNLQRRMASLHIQALLSAGEAVSHPEGRTSRLWLSDFKA